MWNEVPNSSAALPWPLTSLGNKQVAIMITTFVSVGMGAAGATGEALELLKSVRRLVDAKCATLLAARFWRWYWRGAARRGCLHHPVEAMMTSTRTTGVECRRQEHVPLGEVPP